MNAMIADLLLAAQDRMELTEEGWVEKVVHPVHGRASVAVIFTLGRLGVPEGWIYDNVRLTPDHDGLRYVPDLFVVRPENPVQPEDERDYAGAPDLAVEILSPSSLTRDQEEKRRRYAARGIPHYWMVDPRTLRVQWLRLEGDATPSRGGVSAH
jgi:Uma2 family endonuclease